MFNAFERMVAFRYLRSKRKEGFISVIAGFSFAGIALGVATLIIVMAVMNGFRAELMDRVLGINAHVSLSGYQQQISNYETLKDQILTVPGVTSAAPVIEAQVMASANDTNSGAYIRAMTKEDFINKKVVSKNIKEGSVEDFKGVDSVFVGSRLASQLGIKKGDVVRLISPQTTQTVMGAIPRHKDYEVAGIFEVGMYEYDSITIFMPLEAAQLFFKYPNSVSGLEIMVADPNKATQIAAEIFKRTRAKYSVSDWKMANSHFLGALKVERNVMFIILTLIILVAAFNIISSLIMLVKDKGGEIAILRTMGATKYSVMRIFFMCGASIGLVGTGLGFILGLLFSLNIERIRKALEALTGTELFSAEVYFLSQLPAKVVASDVISVVLMSLALSFLATIFPAYKASKLSPAEALRYE